MTDLSTMKARIADDIARSDLTTQIASAITTAIEEYQDTRFFFNESRSFTFSTVADQDIYTSSDDSNIPDLIDVDWATILINSGDLRTLDKIDPQELDYDAGNTSSTNQPYAYSYFGQQFRLYPKPSGVWTVRINGNTKVAAPASDAETGNPWMTYAERLIRSRAKYELAEHVLMDQELAVAMSPEAPPPGVPTGYQSYRSFQRLRSRTSRQNATGRIKAYC